MERQPLISVIVPCYKVEKYLPKCVGCLLQQTYKNLEIILVDDGSPDRCGEICDDYAETDSRVKVIHKVNGGLSDARNVAIDVAHGKYLTFVDSDDYVANDYVEILINLCIKYDADVSVVNPIFIDESGDFTHVFPSDDNEYCFDAYSAIELMFYQMLFDTSAWGKLYKKSLFDGVRYPKGIIFEDLPTTYLLFAKSNKIAFKNKEVYYYLIRKTSIEGASFNPHKLESALHVYRSMEEHNYILKNVEDAYKCRMFSFAYHLLLQMPNNYKNAEVFKAYVYNNRLAVLLNRKARKKARIAAGLSYLGMNVVRYVFSKFNRRK